MAWQQRLSGGRYCIPVTLCSNSGCLLFFTAAVSRSQTDLKCLVLLNSFPAVLSMFAVYRLLRPMGLINHRTGLILIYTGTMAVFSLWNIKGYFDTVPVEIEEAARMDGANPLQVVTRIVLPLAKPSIVVTALMVLIYVWNEYIYATTFMTGEENYTLAAGLYALQATEMSGSWPVLPPRPLPYQFRC